MRIGVRILLFLFLTAAIWVGDFYAQKKLLKPAAAVAQGAGDDAATNLEVRQQRRTALVGAGIAINFFAVIPCFATGTRKPARGAASNVW